MSLPSHLSIPARFFSSAPLFLLQPTHHDFSRRHYGQDVISTLLSLPVTHPTVATLYPKLYADFVEALDGIDNGISAQSGPTLYRSRTDLSSRVGQLNPRWNEDFDDSILDKKFLVASELAGSEFLQRLDYLAKAWLPAREIILSAVESRKSIEQGGRVVVFESFAPWKVSNFSLSSLSRAPCATHGMGQDEFDNQNFNGLEG